MDKDYIAPQLTLREAIAAGAYVVFSTALVLFAVGIPALVANLFSPTFPRRLKIGNALVLALPLLLLGGALALVFLHR